MPPSGGRGQGATAGRGGAGRGGAPSQGRGPGVVRNTTQQNIIAATTHSTHVAETQPAIVAAIVAPVAAAASVSVSSPTGTVGWGCGTTLAEKLKQAEIQKLLPPPLPVVQVIVVDQSEVSTMGKIDRVSLF